MIRNINYRGFVDPKELIGLQFSTWKPCQYIDRDGPYTLIFFRNGKCRIMGCKKPIDTKLIKYKIKNIQIQSVTVTIDLGTTVNLYQLSGKKLLYLNFYNITLEKLRMNSLHEPELFPALRYTKYNPLCVNVFSSGKVVILGLKSLNFKCIVNPIINDIKELF